MKKKTNSFSTLDFTWALVVFAFAIVAQPSLRATQPWGTALGSFNGVTSYSNGSTLFDSGIHNSTGLEWQCVEYVQRYYSTIYGVNLLQLNGGINAWQFFGTASTMQLSAYPNGGTIAPQTGDILCFGQNGGLGHVAIVRNVDSAGLVVHVIQQNVKNGDSSPNGFGTDVDWMFSFTINAGHYTVDGSRLGQSYFCQGWLRKTAAIQPPVIDTPGDTTSPGAPLTTLTPTFTWTAANGATGYGLYIRNLTDNILVYPNSSGTTATPLTGTSFTLPSGYLINNKAYRWAMTSFNGSSETGQGSYRYFQTAVSSLAAPAANEPVNVTSTSFVASWTPVQGATGYRIDVSTGGTFLSFIPGYQNLDVGNVLSKTVQGLAEGEVYAYRVRAYNASTTSPSSNPVGVVLTHGDLFAPLADPPTGITTSGFTANWEAVGGATGYRLDVGTSPTFAIYVQGYQNVDVGNVLSRTLNGLNAGTDYYYRVRAYNATMTSTDSGTINARTEPLIILNAPFADFPSGVSSSAFTANWHAVANATGYRIDVSTDREFGSYLSGYQNLDVGNALARTLNNLTPNTTYYYRVRAYASTSTSTDSATVEVTTSNSLAAPAADFPSGITTSGFTANWHAVAGATGYRLDIGTSPTFAIYVQGYQNFDAGNALSRTLSGLNAGTDYYYRVRAYNATVTSTDSATVNAKTDPLILLNAPFADFPSGVSSSSFTANWHAVDNASGYRLDVSTDREFASFLPGYQNLDVGNTLARTLSSLSPNTTYYYRVRAYNAATTSTDSTTVEVATSNSLAAPAADFPSGITTSGFTANWHAVAGATGYRLDVGTSATFAIYVQGYQDFDVGNALSRTLSGLSAGTDYYYRVRAYNTTVTSTDSATVNARTDSSSTGAIQVTIDPSDAGIAGSQWRVDDGEWKNSGATASDLALSPHTISYKAAYGWTAPDAETITLTSTTVLAKVASFAKHHLQQPNKNNGTLTFSLFGEQNASYAIERSTDLNTWSFIKDVVVPVGGSIPLDPVQISGPAESQASHNG